MTSSWWLRMGDPVCMCITLCQWSEHYLCAGRCCYKLSKLRHHHQDNYHLANRDWLHDLMTLPGCSIIIIDLFSLYPGLHMCKQGLPVNTGSLAACCWSRVWAAVGTVASRVTAGCLDCVILWWFVWCIDRINVNKDFLIIIWLGTFRFINVCIREIPCFKWNYNVNLDVAMRVEPRHKSVISHAILQKLLCLSSSLDLMKHGVSKNILNFSLLWKKLIPLARSCWTKVLQEFSELRIYVSHD